MTDEENVGEGFVVRDHDEGPAGIFRHGAGVTEAPKRVQRRHGRPDLPENTSRDVAAAIKGCGEQPSHGEHREPQDDAHDKDEPGPDRQDRLPESRHATLFRAWVGRVGRDADRRLGR
jgi:hypothetical protein